MSTDVWMDKEDMVYKIEYYSGIKFFFYHFGQHDGPRKYYAKLCKSGRTKQTNNISPFFYKLLLFIIIQHTFNIYLRN